MGPPVEKDRRYDRPLLPFLVLLLSLIVTVVAAFWVSRNANDQDRLRFESTIQRIGPAITTQVDVYVTLLRGASGFFAGNDDVERDEFRRFAEGLRLRSNYPGVQGIGYSARVVPQKRALFEERLRREGRPSFRIWPEGSRPEYHAIIYLEPVDRRNRVALGFDMYTEPMRRAAMERARDAGTEAISGKVTLVQEIDKEKQAGFAMYHPVYGGGAVPATLTERRDKLMGFVYCPFRADDLFQRVASTSNHRGVDFRVYDSGIPRGDRLLYDSASFRPPLETNQPPRFTARRQLKIRDRVWTLTFSTRPEFFTEPGAGLVPSTLGVGFLVSILLFLITRSQVRARADEEWVTEHLRNSEQELKGQTQTLEAVNRIGRILSAELDLNKLVQAVTDAATSLARAQFGIFLYDVDGEDAYSSFAVSGISREAFTSAPPNTAVFGPTFREGIVRVDDVTKDPHYETAAPFHGIRYEHDKVRSYMAIPVVSRSGEILGGLFFGHSRAAVFSDREERIVESLAAQAAVAVDNARLYEAAQRDRRMAEQANRAKDDFLATLSHELRTPMTAILGWSSLLESGSLDEQTVGTAVDAIRRSSLAQAQLIDDLLDVSRIASGKVRLDRKPVDLGLVIESAADSVRPAANARGIVLEIEVPLDPVVVHGDASRLQQIVWNLLSNAVKFEREGGRVVVRVWCDEGNAVIEVRDFGLGIDSEFLPHMFKKFRQAESGATRSKGGLGLGLSIAKQLTEMHGGSIEARSEGKGQGSTFLVSIPLAESGARIATADPVSADSGALAGCDVVVVEDERDVRQFVAIVLEQSGASVRQAASAQEAMDLLQDRLPDVLVSDIAMPGEDGISLIRRIRSSDKLRTVPALAITAYARPEEQDRILDAGFQRYLQKPVQPGAIVAAVVALRSSGDS